MSGIFLAVNRTALEPLTASASPTTVSGSNIIVAPDDCTVTTNSTTVTPSGGVAPYSYSWAYVAGSGNTATPNNPTSATTDFTRSVFIDLAGQSIVRSGVFRCTVTDSASQTATVDVTVETTHNSV